MPELRPSLASVLKDLENIQKKLCPKVRGKGEQGGVRGWMTSGTV
jgi:hypothetical protein